MRATCLPGPRLLLAAGAAGMLLAGCSDLRDDPRVTFCKRLTASMLGLPEGINWMGQENRCQRPECAAITLRVDYPSTGGGRSSSQSTCYFEYNAVEEDAMTHSSPLSAYSSLLYKTMLYERTVHR